jgi:pyruvate dehydrogenase E1 component alpha subunit
MPISNEELLRLYRQMLLIRRFEDRAGVAYTQDKVGGYLHLYIGQEAVGCGFISVLRPDDYLSNAYRDHGHFLAKGGDPKAAMAELFGKATGCSGGKGGSMHFYSSRLRFLGGTGIVGAGIGLGAGAAFAIKYRGGDQVCLSIFGDGAFNTGMLHECLNMAALWGLPVIFLVENNMYAMGTALHRSSAETNLAARAEAQGLPAERVDGMDLFACRDCAERVVHTVRTQQKPYFVEAITYRYRGHGAADPSNYRTREEVDEWRNRDPIGIVEKRLLELGVVSEEQLPDLQKAVAAEVDDALAFAESSPAPAPEALFEHIYAP